MVASAKIEKPPLILGFPGALHFKVTGVLMELYFCLSWKKEGL